MLCERRRERATGAIRDAALAARIDSRAQCHEWRQLQFAARAMATARSAERPAHQLRALAASELECNRSRHTGTRVFVAVGYFDPLASATGVKAGANVPVLATSALVRCLVAYTVYDLRVVAVGLLGLTSSNRTAATTDDDGNSTFSIGKHAEEYRYDIVICLVCLSSSSIHVRADGECGGHCDSGAQMDRSSDGAAARHRSLLQPLRDSQLCVGLCIHFGEQQILVSSSDESGNNY